MRAKVAICTLALACSATPVASTPPPDPPYVAPPETCSPVDVDAVQTFNPCSIGSGIFGQWTLDEDGLPAYDYVLDENADPRARWFNTEGRDRREHWSSFGNARVTALAYNDGTVELTTQDRGETYLNKVDEAQGAFGGGFSYIDDGSSVWSSAYKWRPKGSKTTRRFGINYFATTTTFKGLSVSHRIFTPTGQVPVVLDDVILENTTNVPLTFKHYEYWDVARRQIETNWLVSGSALKSAPTNAAIARDARNSLFQEHVTWDAKAQILGMRRTQLSTPPVTIDQPSAVDYYPGDPFLAVLIGSRDAMYTDQATFFGAGGPKAPSAIVAHAPGDPDDTPRTIAAGQPRMFVVRTDVTLPAHGKQALRFGYGYAPMTKDYAVEDEWHNPKCDMRTEARDALKKQLMYFASSNDGQGVAAAGALHRELAWHTAQLEASIAMRDYWAQNIVPQGSAYLYLHGADGAARDLALFAIPLVYTDPAVAEGEIEMLMGMQRASDASFVYAFQGHGLLDDALGVHAHPSDLDIFFLWAFSEFVGATGFPLMDVHVPYYPREARPTALGFDHVKDAVRHLFDVVGVGPHGLIRIGDGDWSDGIVFEAADRDLAQKNGESVPNTQMAVAVLPRVADLVESHDAALSKEIRGKVALYKQSLAQAWTGQFYGRAYFGDGKLAYADKINLESQVWALVGDELSSPSDRATLVAQIGKQLDDPSPAGATLVPGGQVWPAISGLLSWGYSKSDPGRAWSHLTKNTMTGHALAFPSIWYGIWSGPDGLNSAAGDRPGESWYSPVTPMVDFPVMNANQHAMPLLATLRTAGVDASATGLVIDPHVPGKTFTLNTELLDLSQRGPSIKGAYRPIAGNVSRTIEVRAPAGGTIASASLDGTQVLVMKAATSVVMPAPPSNGKAITFEVVTSP